ncbi:histidine kinase : ATP-binding region ATPase domain protein OS=Gemmatimonadetes bacterium KBS708 GN=J421_6171 PE=4 SV=1: HisKA: HATPase_c [Gemmataceae bacterium]|nr:histidine kinase : ATP-binding region ATPase domain protein OS=Gemmatimonadetes bacterium KBS708 GN=J421_6171 PE=4 SV=1: HisKA: HATPase_c [Gemmataceae bacterium]VTT99024.1 histidine kinase : ATP-binding region ATPase domain protein OS=Gemmatimonadetes bacterium KBS708 GN=J421_6171 PE=4 SV=1: HisKA: HATPase_c [Gemmataceae bacterium]
MRLADFIATNLEPIIAEWEAFARTHVPAGEAMDVAGLRDHAADILKAVAADLRRPQTERERGAKGTGDAGPRPGAADTAAETHGALRAESGFTLGQMVSEFRALRASVVRLWRAAGAGSRGSDFEDLTRFNEAIDQALAESLTRYARDLDHSKEMFLAILGHDVRTPLGAIMMSATGLLVRPDLAPAHQAAASRILNSGARIKGIVNDLLDLTRARLGAGIPLACAEMDLGEVGRQTVEEVAAYHPDRDLRFEASGPVRGSWDAARLGQALSNLVGNAVQHGSPAAPVAVAVRGAADEVAVSIHNRGAAIPPAHVNLIFSPLKRIAPDTPRPQDSGSMGLGLYIANEIVKGHGGRIDVESSDAGGTTFTVRLPRHHPAA